MKDTRFMERKCFVITSEALLEFMKEQKDDICYSRWRRILCWKRFL